VFSLLENVFSLLENVFSLFENVFLRRLSSEVLRARSRPDGERVEQGGWADGWELGGSLTERAQGISGTRHRVFLWGREGGGGDGWAGGYIGVVVCRCVGLWVCGCVEPWRHRLGENRV
jgi:hypothetical protein